jgi:hypothetical protein
LSLALKEEHRLRVFEKRVLRRIFRARRQKVMGSWRKLHNEEVHNLYSSTSMTKMMTSRRMRLVRHVSQIGRSGCRLFVGKKARKKTENIGR